MSKPKKPALPTGRVWHPMARAWWLAIWASPLAMRWTTADRYGLQVLAGLISDFWNATSASARLRLAGKIMRQSEGFGLTPRGRARLGWRTPPTRPLGEVVPFPTKDRALVVH